MCYKPNVTSLFLRKLKLKGNTVVLRRFLFVFIYIKKKITCVSFFFKARGSQAVLNTLVYTVNRNT